MKKKQKKPNELKVGIKKLTNFTSKSINKVYENFKKNQKIKDKKDFCMASPEDVKTQTGYTIGGISPIGHLEKIEIIMDNSLERFNELFAVLVGLYFVKKVGLKKS